MGELRKTLDHVTVADFSHALAGPYAAMLLAEMGADVIKLEEIKGDPFRDTQGGAWDIMTNRDKRNISVDLKTDKGKEVVRSILRKSDVLIESFTPGTMDRLGFGYEDVRALKPDIIYCSISGFGQTGPYRDMRGFDAVAQAMSGLLMNTGDPDRPPVRVGTSAVDLNTGTLLAYGIVLALMERQKTGKGQRIDTSLFESAISLMSYFITYYFISGSVPNRMGSEYSSLCPYRVFEALDGYVFIGCGTDRMFNNLCKEFELTELGSNPKYQKTEGRLEDRTKIDDQVQKVISRYRVNEIVERLRKAGVPVAPVNTVKDVVEDPHAKERGIFVSQDHPRFGHIKFSRIPIMADGTFPEPRSPSPDLGEHSRQILGELGYSDEEIEQMVDLGIITASG